MILGHAHISTTQQIYTHVDEAAKRDAITRLNKLLGGAESRHYCGQHWWSTAIFSLSHQMFSLWAQEGSNLRPLACKASALPLSYAPGLSGGTPGARILG